jgi:hypothetical protein
MKYLIIFLLLNIHPTQAGLDTCLRDAKSHGNHFTPHSPSDECFEFIKLNSDHIEFHSSDNKIKFYGLDYMVYVEKDGKRELLSGDQTKLSHIKKISLNEKKKKILILQSDSVSTFNLDFIGNVSPLKYVKSDRLKNALDAKLLDEEELIAVFSPDAVSILNAEAESRFKDERYKPKLINEISGANAQLKKPIDLIVDSKKKAIYVLDSERVFVFSLVVKKNESPSAIISAPGAVKIFFKNGLVYSQNSEGLESAIQLP